MIFILIPSKVALTEKDWEEGDAFFSKGTAYALYTMAVFAMVYAAFPTAFVREGLKRMPEGWAMAGASVCLLVGIMFHVWAERCLFKARRAQK